MNTTLVAFVAGVSSVSLLSELPPPGVILLSILLGGAIWVAFGRWRALGAGVLGAGYSLWLAHTLMAHQLPHNHENEPLLLTGKVTGLVETDEHRARFEVEVSSAQLLRTGDSLSLDRVLLSHYRPGSWFGRQQASNNDWLIPETGEVWTWVVRLRRPRGFANPGGFDYQASLLRRGVSGVGYVSASPIRLDEAAHHLSWMERVRNRARQHIDDHLAEREAALLKALVLGDLTGFSAQQWAEFRDTGTVHLVIISGLHIGMLAGLGFIGGMLLGRMAAANGFRWPAQWWAALSALAVAALYAALAGFSVPVQRALAMVSAGLIVLLLRRVVCPWSGYCLALAIVLAINPLVVTGAGFWLSFMAVMALFLSWQGRRESYLRALLRTQWVITLGLFPWLLFWIGAVPALASLVNFLVVPWVGLVVLPLGFATLLLDGWWPDLFDWCWLLLGKALGMLLYTIHLASKWLGGDIVTAAAQIPTWLWWLTFLVTPVVLLPLPWRLRWMGFLPSLLLVSAVPIERPLLRLAFLDVGQGLAVVIQAEQRVLVYDTGPEYSPDFNAGAGIVVPFLAYHGVREVDRLIISHSHLDHAGGMAGLLDSVPVDQIISGEPMASGPTRAKPCTHGSGWAWGEIEFTLLSARSLLASPSANNSSCVVLIHFGDTRLLLTGDIEREAEEALVTDGLLSGPLTVLQAAHHGSNTSSTPVFLEHLNPKVVVFSRGYKHRFGHPHPHVERRFEQLGSISYDTALHGAVVIEWRQDGDYRVSCWRNRLRGYWIDRSPCPAPSLQ